MLSIDQIRARLAGQNLAKLAIRVGVTRSYLCNIRSGKSSNPSYKVLSALSRMLGESDDK